MGRMAPVVQGLAAGLAPVGPLGLQVLEWAPGLAALAALTGPVIPTCSTRDQWQRQAAARLRLVPHAHLLMT